MINNKIFRLESSDGTHMQLAVIEQFKDEDSLLFTWESSLMLAAYILNNRKLFGNSTVLEIGAGVGLPSLTCGHALVGAKQVTITERCEELDTLVNLKDIVTLNGLDSTCTVQSLSWDQPQTWPTESCDFVLGSDVFYSTEDFTPLISFISHIFTINPRAIFLTTYKNRSARRSLAPHLQLYGMKAEVVPAESFCHSCHLRSGVCLFANSTSTIVTSPMHNPIEQVTSVTSSAVASNGTVVSIDETQSCDRSFKRKRLGEAGGDIVQQDSEVEEQKIDYTLERVTVFDEMYLLRIQLI